MNLQEAKALWEADRALHAARGVVCDAAIAAYLPAEFKMNFEMALDAQPTLATTSNSGIPAWLTTLIDPEIFKILFSPNKGAKILGEKRKGTWIDETAMFPTTENTGEVSSYDDYSENGSTNLNANFPQRQSYLFQTIEQYGERQIERAGLARLNWVSEMGQSSATIMDKYMNLSYFFGVAGLANYGLTNDPNLSAAITPATKAAGGTKWINGGVIVATANEIYLDIQSLFYQLVTQSNGTIEETDKMVLAMSPLTHVALTATNAFGVNVGDLLKKNFPNIRIETAVQYGATSSSNNQGIAAGNMVQLLAERVEGQETGYCSFNEKMRSHPIIRQLSSFKKKVTGGSWGAIIRQPFAIAQMVGV